MTKAKQKAWVKNLIKFSVPLLIIFLVQLSQGVDWKMAGTVVLYAFYSSLADYLKKLK